MKRALIGAAFGLVLFVLGAIIAGFGHGILVPLLIASSPLSGSWLVLAAPLVWTAFGWLTSIRARWIFPAVMATHYIAPLILFLYLRGNGELEYPPAATLSYFKPFIIAFILIYLTGQTWLWWAYTHPTRRGE